MPVVLSSPRRRSAILAAMSALFFAGGLGLLADGQSIGIMGVVFFGFGLLVSGLNLISPNTLHVTADGLVVRSLGVTQPIYRWAEVDGFEVWPTGRWSSLITFDYSGAPRRWQPGMAMRGSRRLSGRNSSLPDPFTYGIPAAELAALLQHTRDQNV